MKTKLLTITIAISITIAALLGGCSTIDKAQNVYGAVRAGYGANSAFNSAKDLRDATPAFQGYTSVVAYAELQPHEGDVASIKAAFADNLRYLVDAHAQALGARLQSCVSIQRCGGRVLALQFTEDAYGGSFAEKITMGNKLKGRLQYVDQGTGSVIAEKRIEGVSNYAEVLGLARGSILGAMLKSYPNSGVQSEALENIPAVKPGYERLLASN